MTSTKKNMTRFFKECALLSTMVKPSGAVSAQDYDRLLKVAKQYRKLAHKFCTTPKEIEELDAKIKTSKLKTVAQLKKEQNPEFDGYICMGASSGLVEDIELGICDTCGPLAVGTFWFKETERNRYACRDCVEASLET